MIANRSTSETNSATTLSEESPFFIQPQGWLLAFDWQHLRASYLSSNCESLFECRLPDLLGQSASFLLEPIWSQVVAPLVNEPLSFPVDLSALQLRDRLLQPSVHRTAKHLILELEEVVLEPISSVPLALMQQRLQGERDPERFLTLFASQVRQLTGHDRVSIFRLEESGGVVVAEDRVPELPSHWQARLSAADVAPATRQLYAQCRFRIIADLDACPIAVVGTSEAAPLDLSRALLRAATPNDRERIRAAGCRAVAVLPLFCEDTLWGLVCCQHDNRRRVSAAVRSTLTGLAAQVEACLPRLNKQTAIINAPLCPFSLNPLQLPQHFSKDLDAAAELVCSPDRFLSESASRSLLQLVDAQGAAVAAKGQITTIGRTPTVPVLKTLLSWLADPQHLPEVTLLHPQGYLFATDQLSELFPGSVAHADRVVGLLALRVAQEPDLSVLWFRGPRPKIEEVSFVSPPLERGQNLSVRQLDLVEQSPVGERSQAWSLACKQVACALRQAILLYEARQAGHLARLAQRREEQFRIIFESSPVGLVILDESGRITRVNAALARMLGYETKELLGHLFEEFCSQDAEEATQVPSLSSRSNLMRLEQQFFRKDGHAVWGRLAVSTAHDASGQPLGIVVIQDITDRKQSELLLTAENRIAALLQGESSLQELASPLLATLCELLGWQLGECWQISNRRLTLMNVWCPDNQLRPFVEVAAGQSSHHRTGPGTLVEQAWRLREPVWRVRFSSACSSITNETECGTAESQLASKVGLQVGVAIPILVHNHCVAVLTLFARRLLAPGAQLKAALSNLSLTLSRYLEHRRAQSALRQSEARFQAFMNNSPLLAWINEESGRLVYANTPYQQLLETAACQSAAEQGSEIPLVPFWRHKEPMLQVLRTGQSLKTLESHPQEDGRPGYYLVERFALPSDPASPSPRLVGGVAIDVTDRVLAEERLQASERRYRFLSETIPTLVWVFEAIDRPVHFNQRWCEYTGLDEATLARNWMDCVHPEDQPAVREAWQRTWATAEQQLPQTFQVEFRLRAADGSYRWHLSRGQPIQGPQGQLLQWFGTCTDIHDLKEAIRLQREAADAAEAANRAKSAFLANVSHELRTPLGGILGMTELALDGVMPSDTRERLKLIKSSAERLRVLVDDLLDLARIDAGKLTLIREPFDVRELVVSTLTPLSLQARGRGLRFELRIAPDTPHLLVGDPHRIAQVLLNLVSNAVKFTHQGEIVVSACLQPPSEADRSHSLLVFEIADTGIGIPEDRLEAIFEPFEQASLTISRRYGGTGLGLGIARRLVHLMGGRIEVRSQLGKGTTFTFTVQVEPTPPATDQQTSSDSSNAVPQIHRTLHILLADDQAINQRLVGEMLRQAGHSVRIVSDGQQAVERFAQEPFDLLLLDLQMPELDGLEATRLIRQLEMQRGTSVRRVPIIALTARAMAGDREECLKAGMDDFVTKPINREDLFARMARLVCSEEPTAPLSGSSANEPEQIPAISQAPTLLSATLIHLLEKLGGNQELLAAVIECYQTDVPPLLGELRQAVHSSNASGVYRYAHKLVSLIGNFEAPEALEAARCLEVMGRQNNLHDAQAQLDRLENQLEELNRQLRGFPSP